MWPWPLLIISWELPYYSLSWDILRWTRLTDLLCCRVKSNGTLVHRMLSSLLMYCSCYSLVRPNLFWVRALSFKRLIAFNSFSDIILCYLCVDCFMVSVVFLISCDKFWSEIDTVEVRFNFFAPASLTLCEAIDWWLWVCIIEEF